MEKFTPITNQMQSKSFELLEYNAKTASSNSTLGKIDSHYFIGSNKRYNWQARKIWDIHLMISLSNPSGFHSKKLHRSHIDTIFLHPWLIIEHSFRMPDWTWHAEKSVTQKVCSCDFDVLYLNSQPIMDCYTYNFNHDSWTNFDSFRSGLFLSYNESPSQPPLTTTYPETAMQLRKNKVRPARSTTLASL